MAITAPVTTRPMTGATWLDWLRPAMEKAALAKGCCPSATAGLTPQARVATRTPYLDPCSVKATREFARETLQRWDVADLTNDVGVVLSELLTNALRHAVPGQAGCSSAGAIRVGLLSPGSSVLCAVADPSAQVPVVKEPDYLAETGRGLHVVASLSDRWGWTPPGHAGKVVWATFRVPGAS